MAGTRQHVTQSRPQFALLIFKGNQIALRNTPPLLRMMQKFKIRKRQIFSHAFVLKGHRNLKTKVVTAKKGM